MQQDRRHNKALILLVDDDATIRVMVKEVVKRFGFEVMEATNGAAALEILKSTHPDLIILDVVMPEMDGFTVCADLRRLPAARHTPILMMTGLDDVESIHRAMRQARATSLPSLSTTSFSVIVSTTCCGQSRRSTSCVTASAA